MRSSSKHFYQRMGEPPEKLDTPVNVVNMAVEESSLYRRHSNSGNAMKKWIKRGIVFAAAFIIGLQAYMYFWTRPDSAPSFADRYDGVLDYFFDKDNSTEGVPYNGENITVDFKVSSKSHLLFATSFGTENLHIKLIIPKECNGEGGLGHVKADLMVKDKEVADKIRIRIDVSKKDHFSWHLEHVHHELKAPVNGTIYITLPGDLDSIRSFRVYFMDAKVSTTTSLAGLRVKDRFEIGGGRGEVDVHGITAHKAMLRVAIGSLRASFRGYGKLHTVVGDGDTSLQVLPALSPSSGYGDGEDIEKHHNRVTVEAKAVNGSVCVDVKDPAYRGTFKAIGVNGRANVTGTGLEFDVRTSWRQVGRRGIEKYGPARHNLGVGDTFHAKGSSVAAVTANGNATIAFP